MTTLVLQAADTALGGLAGAASAYASGALASALGGGSVPRSPRIVDGPRLTEMNGLSSSEGAPIPRLYGRARIGGQLIWATRFEEVANTTVERQASRGGKGFGSSKKAATTVTTSYSYFANLAIGLCEGPIAFVRRVWADGREVDGTKFAMRVHRGTEDQVPDPLIVAKEGAEQVPAYRGLAYVVFERLPLAEFGNRIPQFAFEVVRGVDGLRQMIRSVCLIPGASEFGYDTAAVARDLGLGAYATENTHQFQRGADVSASLDWLTALCPNLRHVSLVVAWFGDDLRAGSCTVEPRVEYNDKVTIGGTWSVAGLTRPSAREVSRVAGLPAYGGTPSDESVSRLLAALKARGLEVTLYPFLMMDIPAGNELPDPRTGEAGQPPYPWRGRITGDPAPGLPGSIDGTPAAADQVAAFFGTGGWDFRGLILHYAALAAAAGGVEGFVIGSELVGLTRLRSGSGTYPAVTALKSLAGDARAILGGAPKIVYAADWTEYGAHVVGGGDEVRFPLDPLWADENIDAIGIDDYPPLSDWRDGPDHLDLADSASIYDVGYLRGRLGSGEAFDWYYANEADRLSQVRTPITDGAYGKPWTYRAKDLVGWWSNAHVERNEGVEIGATAWVPGSKPIWLTEIGIPAVDKATNGPNVFPDPKSAESAAPPLSRGTRDDLIQLRGLEAMLSRFDPALPGHDPAHNPGSGLYAGRMVDPARVSVWAWDARPYPAFPALDTVWADGANWSAGHWITGRIEGAPLDRLISGILDDYGLAQEEEPAGLDGFVDGYVVDRPMSARAALEPLGQLFGFDAAASAGSVSWRARGGRVAAAIGLDDLAASGDEPVLSRSRAQETDLPASFELGFTDGEADYGRAAVGSRRLAGSSRREAAADPAIVTRRGDAQRLADIWLQDAWAGRETAEFRLSPKRIDLEPGDVVSLGTGAGPTLHRITRIMDATARRVETRAVEPAVFTAQPRNAAPARRASQPVVVGRPSVTLLDLAATPSDPSPLQYLAVAAEPWPGAVALWRRAEGEDFALHAVCDIPAVVGRTLGTFPPGPVDLWDDASGVDILLSAAAVSSIGDAEALGGGNLFALSGADGEWEVFTAAVAEPTGSRRYRLSRCLRGLGGTEALAGRSVPSGATIVRLDEAVLPLTTAIADLGRTFTYRIGPADRDHADGSYVELSATASGRALKPLSPVHVTARRTGEGVAIGWIRRPRAGGDNWELAEVPLGEEVEAYAVEILDGGLVRRSWTTGAPAALYAATDEIADFGAAQAHLSIRVAQISAIVGRGFERAVTVPVL